MVCVVSLQFPLIYTIKSSTTTVLLEGGGRAVAKLHHGFTRAALRNLSENRDPTSTAGNAGERGILESGESRTVAGTEQKKKRAPSEECTPKKEGKAKKTPMHYPRGGRGGFQ